MNVIGPWESCLVTEGKTRLKQWDERRGPGGFRAEKRKGKSVRPNKARRMSQKLFLDGR